MQLDAIKRSVKNAVDENGQIKNWETQLLEFEYGEFDPTSPLLLSQDSKALAYSGVEDKPIAINITTIQKIKSKHAISLKILIKLHEILNNAVFSFESQAYDSSLIFVTDIKQNNSPVTIVLRKNKQMNYFTVNEITSVYDRKNLQNLIQTILADGKQLYINPNKVEQFLQMNYQTNPEIEQNVMNFTGFKKLECAYVKNTKQKEIIVADSLFAANSIMQHQKIDEYNYYIALNGVVNQTDLEEQFDLKTTDRIIFSNIFKSDNPDIQKICSNLQNKKPTLQFGFQDSAVQKSPVQTKQIINR